MSNEPSAEEPKPMSLWRQSMAAEREINSGFDGALLLVAIGRVLSPFLLAFALYRSASALVNPEVWQTLTDPNSPIFSPLWWPLLVGEVIGNTLLLLFSLVLLWLMFGRRRAFPWSMIAFLLLNVAFRWAIVLTVNHLTHGRTGSEIANVTQSTLWALIWIPYFLFAERVKNTFVR